VNGRFALESFIQLPRVEQSYAADARVGIAGERDANLDDGMIRFSAVQVEQDAFQHGAKRFESDVVEADDSVWRRELRLGDRAPRAIMANPVSLRVAARNGFHNSANNAATTFDHYQRRAITTTSQAKLPLHRLRSLIAQRVIRITRVQHRRGGMRINRMQLRARITRGRTSHRAVLRAKELLK